MNLIKYRTNGRGILTPCLRIYSYSPVVAYVTTQQNSSTLNEHFQQTVFLQDIKMMLKFLYEYKKKLEL